LRGSRIFWTARFLDKKQNKAKFIILQRKDKTNNKKDAEGKYLEKRENQRKKGKRLNTIIKIAFLTTGNYELTPNLVLYRED
jgi:hypothetical protein